MRAAVPALPAGGCSAEGMAALGGMFGFLGGGEMGGALDSISAALVEHLLFCSATSRCNFGRP